MKLSVLLKTIDFRGDHAADVAIAHELRSGETVEELAHRLLVQTPGAFVRPGTEVIEIRLVVEPESEAA